MRIRDGSSDVCSSDLGWVPWTIIDGVAAAAGFADRLMSQPRKAFGRNAIGSAITFAHLLIESNSINGFRRVIDISGDSANSWNGVPRSDEHTSELQSLMRISYAVFCLKTQNPTPTILIHTTTHTLYPSYKDW